MTLITESAAVAAFCRQIASNAFVAVDTEFIRERTFWPKLCLVQIAGEGEAAAIDAVADGIDLSPVFKLMANPKVLKVFHAGRQDIEIFHHLGGEIPSPIFDTQVAAMVCGFGESASYETLVAQIAKTQIDKSSRFTDWAHRPLSRRQIDYALSDVVHLRTVYEELARRLEKNGRVSWLVEEMAVLTDPETYRMDPREAWRRLKTRSHSRRHLAVLREVAAWRETEAQARDVPRNRVLRDEGLLEIASHTPRTKAELARSRSLSKGMAEGSAGSAILKAVADGLDVPETELPELPPRLESAPGIKPLVELLKVLLKMKCEEHGVAQKLVATTPDLEAIAADDAAPVPALQGWRRKVFGEDALALKYGKLALTVRDKSVFLVPPGA
ncbi:MAG TPA: ribonuclease D [Alphaproteobacteria bacterium]|jgi:ribonuclease D|nr:ribonuclease D [Alphaproteobacteria bacterium]